MNVNRAWRIGLALAGLLALGLGLLHLSPWGAPLRAALGQAVQSVQSASAKKTAQRCVPTARGAASSVLYSTEACPPGTRPQALSGGSVSVLPAPPTPAAAASAPLLHQLADPAEAAALRERRMERVIGR